MRISDWSSDVCSSDLPVDHRGDEGGIACAPLVAGIDARGDPVGVRAKDLARGRGDMFERGEMIEQRQRRLTSPVLALPRKVAAQEQPGFAMIADKQIRLRDERFQDRRRIRARWVSETDALQ